MATPTPAAAVACLWCDHTETGDGYAPHEAIEAHQADVHGRRKQPCGCQYVPNGCGSPLFHWWTCDTHGVPRIKQITALQLANHTARRWAADRPADPQGSLFERTPHA